MGARILIGPLSLFLLISLNSTLTDAQGGDGLGAETARGLWCVAKNNAEDAALQSALDWACGSGGADCGAIQNNRPCYDGSDIQRTASYAFNDYYRKNGPSDENCNFNNNAALTSLDPSHGQCKFPPSNGNFSGVVPAGPGGADLSSSSLVASHWDWGLLAIFAIPLIL